MKIIAATVVQGMGADDVLLDTDMPPSVFPYNENAYVKLTCAADSGPQYVRDNFGIEPKVIQRSTYNPSILGVV